MKYIILLVLFNIIVACGGPIAIYPIGTVEKSPRFSYEVVVVDGRMSLDVKNTSIDAYLKVDVTVELYQGENKLRSERLLVRRMEAGDAETVAIANSKPVDRVCVRYREGTRNSSPFRSEGSSYENFGSFCIKLK